MSELGQNVTVLEAEEIGFGGSGRNGGQVNPGGKILPDQIIAEHGPLEGNKIIEILSNTCELVFDLIQKYQINCAVRQAPYLRAASKKRGLTEVEEWVRQWEKLGKPVQLLDKAQTHNLMGSKFFDGGYTDARGGSLQPLSYCRGLARAAIDTGADIFTRSPAISIHQNNHSWIVKTPDGVVNAQYLVIATNGYTSDLWPGLQKQVIPVASLQTASKPLPDEIKKSILPEGHHASDTRRDMMYFKIDETSRFIIGGRGQAFTPNKQYDDTKHLQIEAVRLYPQLKDIEWEYDWGGLVAITKSHTPLLLNLAHNAYAGLGYNGRGVAMGTVMGKLLSDTIMGESCAITSKYPNPFIFHSFKNLGIFLHMISAKWLDKFDQP